VTCFENACYNLVEFSSYLNILEEVLQGAPIRSKWRVPGSLYVCRREWRNENEVFSRQISAYAKAPQARASSKAGKKDTRK
jgi:hypothetical protein